MKLSILTLLTSIALLSGCMEIRKTESEIWAEKILKIYPDSLILTTNINGFMLGRSPRKIKNIVISNQWNESAYNTQTIDDIIVKVDQGINDSMHVSFEKKGEVLKLADNQDVNIVFCYGKVSQISYKSYIPQKDLEQYVSVDKKRFPKIKFKSIKNDLISTEGRYMPVDSMHVRISYIKRKYFNFPVLERNINLYYNLMCVQKELLQIIYLR